MINRTGVIRGSVALALLVAACSSDDHARSVVPADDAGADAALGAGGKATTLPDAAAEPDQKAPPITPEAGGNPVTDAGPDAAVVLDGVFVNPGTGADANSGEQGSPFKTIAHALTVATPGQSVYLADGTYDDASQGSLQYTVPDGITIQGLSSTGVKIASDIAKNEYVFSFEGSGGVHDVWFQDVAGGITCNGAGTFSASNVHFADVIRPFFFTSSVQATIDATSPSPIFTDVPTDSIGIVAVEQQASLVFTGGDIENITTSGTGVFFVRGDATLKVVGTKLKSLKRRVLVHYDNATVTFEKVSIEDVSWTSSGVENSVLYMGGHQTTQIAGLIELTNTSITGNGIPAIGVTLGTTAYKNTVKLTNSHLDGNTGRAIFVQGAGSPATDVRIIADGTTFDDNTLGGIYAEAGTLSVTGGSISGNGAAGVTVSAATTPTSLTLRGVAIGGNTGDGVSFKAPAASTLDLGTQASAGNLVFKTIPALPAAAVRLLSPIAGTAVGNTWIPNVQGASAAGKFTTPTTIAASVVGNNVTTGAGATLVVAP